MSSELEKVLAKLYAAEINVEIESFFDSGWTAKVGDSINGYRAESHGFYSLEELAAWLWENATLCFPESAKELSSE